MSVNNFLRVTFVRLPRSSSSITKQCAILRSVYICVYNRLSFTQNVKIGSCQMALTTRWLVIQTTTISLKTNIFFVRQPLNCYILQLNYFEKTIFDYIWVKIVSLFPPKKLYIPNSVPKSIQKLRCFCWLLLSCHSHLVFLFVFFFAIPNETPHERNLAGKCSANKVHVFDINILCIIYKTAIYA